MSCTRIKETQLFDAPDTSAVAQHNNSVSVAKITPKQLFDAPKKVPSRIASCVEHVIVTRINSESLGRAIATSRVARGIPGTSQDTARSLAVSDAQQSVTRKRWWKPAVASDYSQEGRLRGCANGRLRVSALQPPVQVHIRAKHHDSTRP